MKARGALARENFHSLIWHRPKRTAKYGVNSLSRPFLNVILHKWGINIPAVTLLRFWTMLAHYHGQTWNAAEPARSSRVTEPTVTAVP